MWVQWAEPPVGGPFDELPEGGVFAGVPDGGAVDEPLGDSVDGDVEPVGAEDGSVVADVGDELLVAALATAAPPPTRTPASPIPATVCRSRNFISSPPFSLIDAWSVVVRVIRSTPRIYWHHHPSFSGSRRPGSVTTLSPTPESELTAHWDFPLNLSFCRHEQARARPRTNAT
jgi:hypothetical protein